MRRQSHRITSSQDRLAPDENWNNFWSRYKTSKPSNVSGWVGKFISFAPPGLSEDDIRFQDIWLRAFQEKATDGKFRMKMIRKADQDAKSWPRAGRTRPDGNDETALEGTEDDSSYSNGFWHPYGRGANVPPTRVVSLSPEALAQVTLKLPDLEQIAAAQAYDFMGGSEITFIADEKRTILTVTYKGEGGGSMLFHQTSWDPVFLEDIDPEAHLVLDELLRGQEPGPPLPEDTAEWLPEGAQGEAFSLRYLQDEEAWERLPSQTVAWDPPAPSAEEVLYRYPDGAFGLYPKTLTNAAPLTFLAGLRVSSEQLWVYQAKYGADRWIDTITWHKF